MGYLTTITFRNDAYSAFNSNRDQLVDEILDALSCAQISEGCNYFSVGNECSPVILQRPRSSDDITLYLHAGNTVVDISTLTEKTKMNEWAINQAISEMEYNLKILKYIIKK